MMLAPSQVGQHYELAWRRAEPSGQWGCQKAKHTCTLSFLRTCRSYCVCERADKPPSTQKVMSCLQKLSTRPVEKAQLWELLAALPSSYVGQLMLPPIPAPGDIKPYSGSSIYTQIKLKGNFIGIFIFNEWIIAFLYVQLGLLSTFKCSKILVSGFVFYFVFEPTLISEFLCSCGWPWILILLPLPPKCWD